MRYLPGRRLPDSPYVPGGRTPRPSPAERIPTWPLDWRQCDDWLWGVDLWNHGYPWEAHEAWEGLWKVAPDAAHRELLQGLIQCAAARVQLAAGKQRGATSLLERGLARLRSIDLPTCMGIEVPSFRDRLAVMLDDGAEHPPIVLVGCDRHPDG